VFEKLEKVKLPEGLQTIGPWSFGGTALTEIEMPASVLTIGENAFIGCAFVSVTLPGVTSVKAGAFYGCSMVSVTMPNVESIGGEAFAGTALTAVYLGATVPTVEDDSFPASAQFYVPDALALVDYLLSPDWLPYAGKIFIAP
jgi:hypothetical protein